VVWKGWQWARPPVRLKLAMANAPRYLVTLGDTRHVPENPGGLRLIPLARPEGTIAAVRYVQIPQWKEMGVKATQVHLSIGHADLMATLGEESFAAAAYLRFTEHSRAILAELKSLCEPEVTQIVFPIEGFKDWEWQLKFNQILQEVFFG
jgi:hypothetical protein